MNLLRKTILPVFLTTLWISINEFIRNEFLLNSFWVDHFISLKLSFPSAPINGAIWGIWSLCFAITIYLVAKKFNLIQTACLSWFVSFVMMWIALGNLGVLPFGILIYAIPLSLFESFVASWIILRLSKKV